MNAPARRGRPPRQQYINPAVPTLGEAVSQILADNAPDGGSRFAEGWGGDIAKLGPDIDRKMEDARRAEAARPDMRPAMREDDPRARAAKRAAELRSHGSLDEGLDKFHVDPTDIPDGWEYEWKRKTLLGKEDPTYDTHLARTGWEPVPTSRHPNYMPSNGKYPIIEREGMVLMERPAEISAEARNIEKRRARDQIRAKEEQLGAAPPGTFERDHEKVRPVIKHSFEAMPIPD